MRKFIPFIPLFTLAGIVARHGLSWRGLVHLAPWLVKAVLLEPLRWIELLWFERKIQRHQLPHDPIFILGHYRCGTTYLQRLFMQDSRLGYMSIFQSAMPEIMLAFEQWLTPALNLLCRACRVQNPFHRIPFTWNFPGEDDVGMIAMLQPRAAQWGMLFPRSMQYYLGKYALFSSASPADTAAWKKDYHYLLKKISLQNNGRRLVLKSPPHTARIKELLEMFPNASFVFIHRDPLEVYASTRRFWQVIAKHYMLGRRSGTDISTVILTQYRDMMERYRQYRPMIPAGRLAEVNYQSLVNEPLPTMQSIYKSLGLPAMEPCSERLQQFIREQSNYRRLQHQLTAEEAGLVKTYLGKLANELDMTATLKNIYRQHLADCIGRQCSATKQHIDRYRRQLANNRQSAGFSDTLKQLSFALCADRSNGAYVHDLDGNEYLDISMGFGVHLFGHSPGFITQALQQQLQKGYSVGPVHSLAGEVAGLLCGMTGNERCAFFNSGTEAVMVALRLARAATGKPKVVVFEGAYHGTHDQLLAIKKEPSTQRALAGVPGIGQSMLDDTILLEFGSEASLRFIAEHADTIAAVMTEPVRSRHIESVQPDFLLQLQHTCRHHGIALVLDEIITGFRLCNGGAKAWFGLDPDIVTYGKVLGGGMPIGVVAGKRKFLDYIDGGDWNFTDDRRPSADTTFVAGTFCHHPLAMAAAAAVLRRLHDMNNKCQQELNGSTAALCEAINRFCTAQHMPVSVAHFGSMFRFLLKPNHKLLYHALLKEKIYLWEGRTCFLSAAHTEAVRNDIVARVQQCLLEMKAAGYFPPPPQTPSATGWYIKAGIEVNALLQEDWLQLAFHYLRQCLELNDAQLRLQVQRDAHQTTIALECLKGVADGWSLTIFLRFLSDCYRRLEQAGPLPRNPFRGKAAFLAWLGEAPAPPPSYPVHAAGRVQRTVNAPHQKPAFEWLLACFALSLGEGDHTIGIPVSGQLAARLINVFGACTCQVPVRVCVTAASAPGQLVPDIRRQLHEAKINFRQWYAHPPATPFAVAFNVDNIKESVFAGRQATVLNILDEHTVHDVFCNVAMCGDAYQLGIKYRQGAPGNEMNALAQRYTALIQEASHVPS